MRILNNILNIILSYRDRNKFHSSLKKLSHITSHEHRIPIGIMPISTKIQLTSTNNTFD